MCIFWAAELDACVGSYKTQLLAAVDNSAFCSFLPSILSPLVPCGILDAVCGCLAPSAVEGEYCPWDRELLQGQWLQHLSNEEGTGTCKGTHFSPVSTIPWLPKQPSKICLQEQVPHEKIWFFIQLHLRALHISSRYLSLGPAFPDKAE